MEENKALNDQMSEKVKKYVKVPLTADPGHLSANQKEMIRILIKASDIMNDLFWIEAYGDKEKLYAAVSDPATIRYIDINYGPWDRLDDNKPFIKGISAKPLGANFYPWNMTKDDFEKADLEDKTSQYTMLRRAEDGSLYTIPYHTFFEVQLAEVCALLEEAAELAEDPDFKQYLLLRSKALQDDEYYESDVAWMKMKNNKIDLVIGPIEHYEDRLYGYKAAHEAYVLIKDLEWSARLQKYAALLPDLQRGLPVPDEYKKEMPGTSGDLNAYDVIYYAGDCNSGSKTIAINLPNDERVQKNIGTRRLQLKNAMKAKFDKILVPISEILIDEDQRRHITFDAFFSNTMFHEVAHGLGVHTLINDPNVTIRDALKEFYTSIEEGKADILGLYMITWLHERGELKGDLEDYYVTFMAGIFRSVRFGASSAHGKANMIRFNYFKEKNAFIKDPKKGTYFVDMEKMQEAIKELSAILLKIEGDGDGESADVLIREKGKVKEDLHMDLEKLNRADIPVDIEFEQGVDVLGF